MNSYFYRQLYRNSTNESRWIILLLGKLNRISKPALSCLKRRQWLAKSVLCVACLNLMGASVWAQKTDTDLTMTSLEDLMNIEVTSVSKKEERLFQTAAAIYVITQEDIRRSGLTSIPELLRLVPGLSVARIDGNKWAISARGFNGRFANKLLVLIDGRSVYSPETSGVYWEAQDVMIEDIERIEVIRGPGGSLWGANAVNGVINIITKRAKDTQGGLATAGGGSEERGFTSVRYGAKIGDNFDYRIYAKYFNRSGLLNQSGRGANDGQDALRGGLRLDWQLSKRDVLTLQGDIYDTRLRETSTTISLVAPYASPINTPGELMGGNALGRWKHTFSERSDMALQIYFDRARRETRDSGERLDTFDLDFQHHVSFGWRQDMVWGFGYRRVISQTNSNIGTPVQFNPSGGSDQLFSAFAQDELTLVKDRLRLRVGAKLVHNDVSGFDLQPSVRLLWTPGERQTIWAAVSRAVRTPAIVEERVRVHITAFPGADGTPFVFTLFGNAGVKSEALRAYELGYRVQPARQFSLDVATFFNQYDRLRSIEQGQPFFAAEPLLPRVVIPFRYGNLLRGETYGLEASANLDLTTRWQVRGSYSFLRMHLHLDAGSLDTISESAEGNSPQHQFQLHSYFKLPRNFDLDTSLYHVARLPGLQAPAFTRLDVRFGWRVNENIELSLGLQNLLDHRQPGFNGVDTSVITSQAKRSFYGKVTWKF
ncbi:MAG: TonB-dependent receptor [Acidobacteriota bacterium]